MDNDWITVSNAARILGVSKQAIRQRIYRKTIPHRKDENGTVFVSITEHNNKLNAETNTETNDKTEGTNRELIDELRDRVSFLERQLETEQAASAELRRIVAGLVQRVPELEPARESHYEGQDAPGETSKSKDTPTANRSPEKPTERRSRWWKKIFFGG